MPGAHEGDHLHAAVETEQPTRAARRRQAKSTLEARLSTAHRRIRQLELLVLTLDPECADAMHCDAENVAIQQEVSKRFDMARPALTTLVAAGVTGETQSVPGGARALRNFGLHAELGCGIEGLPTTSKEAKQRIRGGSRVPLSSDSSDASVGSAHDEGLLNRLRALESNMARDRELFKLSSDALEAKLSTRLAALELNGLSEQAFPANGSYQAAPEDGDRFNDRFLQAMLACSGYPAGPPPGFGLAPGKWFTGDVEDGPSVLNVHAPPFVPEEARHETRIVDGSDDESRHHTYMEHASGAKVYASAGSTADDESRHQTRMVDGPGDEPASADDESRHQTRMVKEDAAPVPSGEPAKARTTEPARARVQIPLNHASGPKGNASAGSTADDESRHQTRMVDGTGDEPASADEESRHQTRMVKNRWTELIDSEPEELTELAALGSPSANGARDSACGKGARAEVKENENESLACLHRFHEHEEEGTEERNPAQHDNQHIIHPRHRSQPTKFYDIDSEPEELTELAVTTTLHRESHEPGPHCNVLEKLSSQWRLLATKCITIDPTAALHVVPSLELLQNYMPLCEASHRCQALQLLSGAFAATDAKSQLATILLQTGHLTAGLHGHSTKRNDH